MKAIYLLLLFVGLTSCGQNKDFEKVDSSKLDDVKIASAKDLALKIMEGQKSSNYYILNASEAEPEMINGLTADVQKIAYEQISSLFGSFDSLQFSEVWISKSGDKYTIYRFKGYFSTENEQPEIRVVLSSRNKLAGFFIKPWAKNL